MLFLRRRGIVQGLERGLQELFTALGGQPKGKWRAHPYDCMEINSTNDSNEQENRSFLEPPRGNSASNTLMSVRETSVRFLICRTVN